MNRLNIFRLLTSTLILSSCFAIGALAQGQLEAAPPLPTGMTGSNANDARFKLTPGIYDAGESATGIKHLALYKKPDAFQLGSDDPSSPKVQGALGALGVGDSSKMPKPFQLVLAQLAFANSDMAFQGKYLFQGNFYGMNIYDISDPAKVNLVTTVVCPGGQGDPSVYKNLLFMSVEMPNGRLDCGTQAFPCTGRRPAACRAERSIPRRPHLRYQRYQKSEAGRSGPDLPRLAYSYTRCRS
jgi:hypothetical protein